MISFHIYKTLIQDMNTKTLLISLTIVTILTFSVQSIRIGNQHKFQSHMVNKVFDTLSHNAFKFGFGRGHLLDTVSHEAFKFGKPHLESVSHQAFLFGRQHLGAAAAPEIPQSVVTDLTNFVMRDKQIMDSMMNGTPLSKSASDRIKDFFLKNKAFNDAMVQSFDKDPHFPQCYKKMKPNQKTKFVNIMIQSMDFAKILNGESAPQPTQAEIDNIIKAIKDDKQLGPDAAKCLGTTI